MGRKGSDGQREMMRVKCCWIDGVDGGGGGTVVDDAALDTLIAFGMVLMALLLEVEVLIEEMVAGLIGIGRL